MYYYKKKRLVHVGVGHTEERLYVKKKKSPLQSDEIVACAVAITTSEGEKKKDKEL
jgi:hypothetical protein